MCLFRSLSNSFCLQKLCAFFFLFRTINLMYIVIAAVVYFACSLEWIVYVNVQSWLAHQMCYLYLCGFNLGSHKIRIDILNIFVFVCSAFEKCIAFSYFIFFSQSDLVCFFRSVSFLRCVAIAFTRKMQTLKRTKWAPGQWASRHLMLPHRIYWIQTFQALQ